MKPPPIPGGRAVPAGKSVRYVVRAGDPRTVSEVVRAAGLEQGAAAAVAEGRVFVGWRCAP